MKREKSVAKAKKANSKKVGFKVAAAPGSEVYLAGSFNDWDTKRHKMRDNPANGVYEIALLLPEGSHEYKFIVNSEWCTDPNCPELAINGLGTFNNIILV